MPEIGRDAVTFVRMLSRKHAAALALSALLATLATLATLAAAFATSPAFAAPTPTPDERREAAALVKRAQVIENEDPSTAIVDYEESVRLAPSKAAWLGLMRSLRATSRFAEALDVAERLQRDYAKELDPKERASVDKLAADLATRCGTLLVDVDVAGAAVIVDGRAVGTAPLRAPIRVSAGRHPIRVSLDGYEPWEGESSVVGQGSRVVEVHLVAQRAPAPPSAIAPAVTAPVTPPAPAAPRADRAPHVAALTAYAAVGAGGVRETELGVRYEHVLTPWLSAEVGVSAARVAFTHVAGDRSLLGAAPFAGLSLALAGETLRFGLLGGALLASDAGTLRAAPFVQPELRLGLAVRGVRIGLAAGERVMHEPARDGVTLGGLRVDARLGVFVSLAW